MWRWRAVTSDDADRNGRWRTGLAAHEISHALGLSMHAVRASYVAARDVLRSLVAEWAGTLPSEVRLERTPLGALYLPDYPLAGCSLSHTSGVVMATLRPNGPVGVDVETISRPIGDLGALVGMACTESEQLFLAALPSDLRHRHFLTMWTGKEAVLKGLGLGLSVDPRDVAVHQVEQSPSSARWHRPRPGAADRWQLERIYDIPDHIATVAVPQCETLHRG
jgi:4'-phosphopantetheinyl transferase